VFEAVTVRKPSPSLFRKPRADKSTVVAEIDVEILGL
jgi:hypothetical protein